MNYFLTITLFLAFAVTFAHSLCAQMLRPEGRLTLTSNTPVMTSDVANTSLDLLHAVWREQRSSF